VILRVETLLVMWHCKDLLFSNSYYVKIFHSGIRVASDTFYLIYVKFWLPFFFHGRSPAWVSI